jgi:hypothetical protein
MIMQGKIIIFFSCEIGFWMSVCIKKALVSNI